MGTIYGVLKMLYLAPPFSSLSQYRFYFSELRFTCLMGKRIQYHIPKEYDIVTPEYSDVDLFK
jgi:hypothetical protein